jgi:uncharacterized protein (TIGR02001 family)
VRPTFHKAVLAASSTVLAPVATAQVGAPNFSGYVTLANDYRHRGQSQADGEGSLQLGIDYRHDSGWFAGAWAANVEYATERSWARPRQTEVDYYVGFDRRQADWSWTVTLSRYAYPDVSFDYDYSEIAGSMSYRDRVFFAATYTDDLLALGRSASTQEVGLVFPVDWNIEVGATLGRLASSAAPGGGYTYWNVGASKIIRRVALDLRFHDSSQGLYTYLGNPNGDQWVLSLSYAIQPKR